MPGISVVPGNAMRSASAGTATLAAGPTAAIRAPRTSTTQPRCGALLTPSNTASGTRRIGFAAGAGMATACATACATAARATNVEAPSVETIARAAHVTRFLENIQGVRMVAFSPVERAAGTSPDTPPDTTKAIASALATSSARTRVARTRCS